MRPRNKGFKIKKFKKFYKYQIKIEDYVFLSFILIYVVIYFVTRQPDNGGILKILSTQLHEFNNSLKWFYLAIIFFLAFIYFTIIINALRLSKQKQTIKLNKTTILKKFFSVIKYAILFSATLAIKILVVANFYTYTSSRLMNERFFDFELNLFGIMPFLWLHDPANPIKYFLDKFVTLILMSFLFLSVGISMVIAYLIIKNKKELLIKYTCVFFLGTSLAIPIWISFPINSPNNYYLSKEQKIENFLPNETFLTMTERTREAQKKIPPITTFPSMHTYWALISVYYLARANKKWLIIGVPWFSLLYLGTFYFAQHYAIDGLLSMIMAMPIIYFVEKIYPWLENKLDKKSFLKFKTPRS